MKRIITIIAMVGTECNLSCRYCYTRATRKNHGQFNKEDINLFIHNCSVGFDNVKFCWHGGEPLLAGIDFYKTVIEAQSAEKRIKQVEYCNSIQSNGMLLNDDWLKFFKENNFRIGLSLDAPPEINITHRGVNINQIVNISEKMRKLKFSVGFICVVSKLNVNKGKEIFEFFKSIGADSYSFLPLRSMLLVDCPSEPLNQELFELYRTTFESWAYTENSIQSIEPLGAMIKSLLGEKPITCSFAASCLKRMITVDYEGNVIPCGSLSKDEFILGNIFKEPLIKIMAKESMSQYKEIRTLAINSHCHNCEFISICRGGCRADAYWKYGSYDGKYPYCEARKETFVYLKNKLQKIALKFI